MRKIAILLVACLVFALSGCQGKAPESSNGGASISGAPESETPAFEEAKKPADSTPPAVTEMVKPESSGGIIEIKEKMFIAQIDDVYLNAGDYLGEVIMLEGMFSEYTWEEKGMTYYAVYRQSPGCCGADGQAGFEVVWHDDDGTYPSENDWVEAVGVLEEYYEDGYAYLRLALTSLTVLPTRGAEFVTQ